jgi:tagatose-6-phosphate ketose/aldose isomerase
MEYLGMNRDDLETRQAIHTAHEITQQPSLWLDIYDRVKSKTKEIKEFFDNNMGETQRILLTGAGTSAFIGLSLQGSYFRNLGKHTQAIPTTDLVSHPYDYIAPEDNIILISFARSGNSPESIAAAEIADRISQRANHIIITCDSNGKLASFETKSKKLVITLPPESNDKGLAMTSSYTGMLLTGLLLARINEIDALNSQVKRLAHYANKVINADYEMLRQLAEKPFSRAVFLGSGPLFGTATEAHLKLQELTDGQVICKKDSYLGFRHGPKAVIDRDTLVMYFLSNQKYVSKYEKDLVVSMKESSPALINLGIFEEDPFGYDFDANIQFSESDAGLDEEFLPVCSIVPAQILAFYKSLNLGYKPDNPSERGAISRVVQGVQIYPLEEIVK